MKREPALESEEPFPQAIDALLGGAEADAAPGFAVRDFEQLGRMLFWPALVSLTLVCISLLQGLAAS
jgi:hypothetical protein